MEEVYYNALINANSDIEEFFNGDELVNFLSGAAALDSTTDWVTSWNTASPDRDLGSSNSLSTFFLKGDLDIKTQKDEQGTERVILKYKSGQNELTLEMIVPSDQGESVSYFKLSFKGDDSIRDSIAALFNPYSFIYQKDSSSNQIFDKWWSLKDTEDSNLGLLDSLTASDSLQPEKLLEKEFLLAAQNELITILQDYILVTEKEDAVFKQSKIILDGEEEDKSMWRYQIEMDPENTRLFIDSYQDSLKKLAQKLGISSVEQGFAFDSYLVDDILETYSFEALINAKTETLHKMIMKFSAVPGYVSIVELDMEKLKNQQIGISFDFDQLSETSQVQFSMKMVDKVVDLSLSIVMTNTVSSQKTFELKSTFKNKPIVPVKEIVIPSDAEPFLGNGF